MIILRLAGGIRQHFGMRVTEWIMTGALFGWSAVLAGSDHTFAVSPAFSELARYGDEHFWSNVCLVAGFVRLIALTVNGTFKGFRYSPHLRALASVVACVFWGQIELAVTVAWIGGAGAGTGTIAYGTFMAIEAWNLFRAWADVGAAKKAT
jgi:hypothetical protein